MAEYLSDLATRLQVPQSLHTLRPVVMRGCIKLAHLVSPPEITTTESAAEWAALTGNADAGDLTTPFVTRTHFCDSLARFSAFEDADSPLTFPSALAAVQAAATLIAVATALAAAVYAIVYVLYLRKRRPGTFLVDVATYNDFRPEWTVSAEEWASRAQEWFNMDPEDIQFTRKILERSGIGNETHFPPGIAMFPPDLSIASARYEAELVMFNCIDQLLKRNNVHPRDIDVLVVNCSLFNPTPSLAAMIINNYGMREDIICYNLSGMGCSASPIAVDLASQMLKVSTKKDPLAIVMSMENITQNIYLGRERAMMVANSLFRMGGAAVLLAKHSYAVGARPAASWRLTNLVRVHLASDTNAYTCVFQDVDKENKPGVRLDKTLMKVAAQALTRNMTVLGPQILPWHEKLSYATKSVIRAARVWRDPTLATALPPVVPNFKTAVQHVAIHAGGRAVIDAIQKALSLSDADVKSSRDVLHKYGNTSSSSIWYEFVNILENRKPRIGDKVWQVAFGSGFKCNSAVWERIA
jgi:3-ketoacyl-CoA synthase